MCNENEVQFDLLGWEGGSQRYDETKCVGGCHGRVGARDQEKSPLVRWLRCCLMKLRRGGLVPFFVFCCHLQESCSRFFSSTTTWCWVLRDSNFFGLLEKKKFRVCEARPMKLLVVFKGP